ncbi:HAD-IA family hydrolase [Oricola cellulosilytica]|uniref:HAD family hydrolase n=1 Tax=Oricola cellulosilytica TaxID=1429082 RepID=A0A4R0PDS7_9HYPH|nr:HAD-IA family hydrolase [Oricola cellulosilytica]TCD13396.1 HAD family hydrolase [Oricola cellulosilytica]
MALRAVIFDVDGTLAETEELHRLAFNRTFEEAGLPWVWGRELYGRLLKVTGGRERLEVYADETGSEAVDAAKLHRRKTEIYGAFMTRGNVDLRPGIERIMRDSLSRGIKLAIATTTSRPNVYRLFEATVGLDLLSEFHSIRTGEDVTHKKPDPEVFALSLKDLGMSADECVVFEDSENGLRAAKALGIPTVATPSIYTACDDFSLADVVVPHSDEPFSYRRMLADEGGSDIPSDLRRLLLAG